MNETLQATVLVPTMSGRGPLLPLSVGSVLAQTVADIEVFIMGDGVDEPTRRVIHELMGRDSRIRFFDHPKHERRGEPHRHAALAQARGKIVCYLCDRDLMLPHHVATMGRLLQNADFAHSLITLVQNDGTLLYRAVIDLAQSMDRQWIVNGWAEENGIPFSFVGHTLAMYRKLPQGWQTTPPNQFTDIYMWRQFLAQPDCRAASGTIPTILDFPRRWRADWTIEQKRQEIQRWSEKCAEPGWQANYLQLVIDSLVIKGTTKSRQLRRIVGGVQSFVDICNRALTS